MHRSRRWLSLLLAAAVVAGCSGAEGASPSTSVAANTTAEAAADTITADTTAADTTAADTTAADTSSSVVAAAVDDLGAVGTLDSATVHTVALTIDEADFEAMLANYLATETKDWLEATITIDGETFEQVGIRLKGNSSLRSISADAEPTELPWMVKLDKFVDDQSLDGLTEFVVRSNSSSTALNEAVALELLDLAGLASQDAIATSFSVNGSEPLLRLVIDNPDDEWMAEEFSASGALYKAESTGDYSYRGDDPTAYDEVFDQEAGKDSADLTPLIEFLQFINESDDATFEAELADRFDVDSFATYLAMQELIDNFDDIDGPGNNSYLYYDTETETFSIVAWDHNLAFGLSPMGGGMGGMGGMGPGGDGFPGEPPTGGARPTGAPDGAMPEGGFPEGGFPEGGGPGGMNRSNILVERFLAVDAWQELYESKLAELRTSLYDSGTAASILTTWTDIVTSSGLVDAATVTAEAEQIAGQIG